MTRELTLVLRISDAVSVSEIENTLIGLSDIEVAAFSWSHAIQARYALEDKITLLENEVVTLRDRTTDLNSVINWLNSGCDPKEAAKELRRYQDLMDKA